jgi:hypothetical protein
LAQTNRRNLPRVCRQIYYDGSRRPVEENNPPKKFQLELIGRESDDRLDKKICPWDAIKMYEFDEGAELSKNLYDPEQIDMMNGVYVMDADEKKNGWKKPQIELYMGGKAADHL